MSSTIPRYQYSRSKNRPAIPAATKPAINLATKPSFHPSSLSTNPNPHLTVQSTPGFAPRPPPIPTSPRPVNTPALRSKKSIGFRGQNHKLGMRVPSPQPHADYTVTAVLDDQQFNQTQIGFAISTSQGTITDLQVPDNIYDQERLQHLAHGLGLGVEIPKLPPTPTFDYPQSFQVRRTRPTLNRSKISASPVGPPPSSPNPDVAETSPYSDISHEIDRIQTEFLTPKLPSGSYALQAKQAIADSRTPPHTIGDDYQNPHNPEDPGLARTESESSSIEELRWSNKKEMSSDGFSSGAEKLFRDLSSTSSKSGGSGSNFSGDISRSTATSVASPYQTERTVTSISSVSDSTQDGPRHRLITSLRASERRFVVTLREALSLFVLPLRLRSLSHSPTPAMASSSSPGWIDGLPPPIGRLFDWLEDIVVVHDRLLSDLGAALNSNTQRTDHLELEEVLLDFVGSLEVYQGYLVRCENVIELIDALVEDHENNDFGEFVLLQSKDPICERSGRNLASYLRMPIARLAEYPVFFKNLLEVTRLSHPTYITTLALFHSCKLTIDVLTEVKRQEEEYEALKHLENRIGGLQDHSSQWRLARRERRLIAQGLLKLIIPVDDDGQTDQLSLLTPRTQELESSRSSRSRSERSPIPKDWDSRSLSSVGSTASEWPQTDATLLSGSMQYTSHPSPRRRAGSQSRSHSEGQEPKETAVYIFVFVDVVLFTVSDSRVSMKQGESLTLMRGIGVSKLLAVCDISAQYPEHEHLLSLDLLPVIASVTGLDIHVTRIYVSLPERLTSRMAIAPSSIIVDARKKWLAAFKQCNQHTIHSLSYPKPDKGDAIQQQDFETSLNVIRSAGLPMPKSPSQQLSEFNIKSDSVRDCTSPDEVEGEREERGFWSLRFHMIMKEKRRARPGSSMGGSSTSGATSNSSKSVLNQDKGHSGLKSPGARVIRPTKNNGVHSSRR